jgi:hypothetical protein
MVGQFKALPETESVWIKYSELSIRGRIIEIHADYEFSHQGIDVVFKNLIAGTSGKGSSRVRGLEEEE